MAFENAGEKHKDEIELLPVTPESEKQNEKELYEKEIALLTKIGEENLNEGQKSYLNDFRARLEKLANG